MRRNVLILFSIVIAFSMQAQSTKKRIADKDLEKFHYAEAIFYYKQLVEKDSANFEVCDKLAYCYRKLNDSKNAEHWYSKVVINTNSKPENKLYYAQALAENKKYAESKTWYNKYSADIAKDSRGKNFSDAYQNMGQFYTDSNAYRITAVSFNSPQLDFSPVYYKDGLVFCSNRDKSSMVRNVFAWDISNYLSLYFADYYGNVTKLKGKINTKYHQGPVTFNKTMDTAIFTRTNYYHEKLGKSNDGTHKLKMYMAVMKKGEWKEIKDLPLNNDQYSVGHPCFSSDGKRLYFVSDMPGGYGGTDIYYADYHNGIIGAPVNLGKTINSEGNEMFPFIDDNNNLYYASDGLPGLGGLDIFFAKYSDGKFNKPVNLGYPINTSKDDFGLIFNSNLNDGYFSSNRGEKGDDNIYKFLKLPRDITLFVYDAQTKEALPASNITIIKTNAGKVEDKSDNAGKMVTSVPANSNFTITVNKEGYYPADTMYLPADQLAKMDIINIPLTKGLKKKTFKIDLIGYVYVVQGKKPVLNAKASLNDLATGTKLPATTDADGNFYYKLEPDKKYLVEVTKPASLISECNTGSSEVSTVGIDSAQTIRRNFPLYCVGDIIKIENIYYDFDKDNIRPDAAVELDKLFKILVDYPTMKIELRSHTDCRGSAEYNLDLSDRRAKSAMKYLVDKGIAADRMIGNGYGESLLVNRCADGVQCTEEEHQMNRRTEFKILSIE